MMKENKFESQKLKLLVFLKGFCSFYLIKIGYDLGLFEKMLAARNGFSHQELADELDLNQHHLKIWCQTAYYMEILDISDSGRYTLAPYMSELLADKGNPVYFGNWIDFMIAHGGEEMLRHGELYKRDGSRRCDGVDAGRTREFSANLHSLSDQFVPSLYFFNIIPSVNGLHTKLQQGAKVLDVGCGSGLLMVTLAKKFPKSVFVGLDIDPFAVARAESRIKENELSDRVSVFHKDIREFQSDDAFDVVNLALSLHEITVDRRTMALKNIHGVLKESGLILIVDGHYPETLEEYRNPEHTYIVLEQFLELSWDSDIMTRSAKHNFLLANKFRDPVTIPLPFGMFETTYAVKQ